MIANGGCCGVDIRITQNCAVPADRPDSGFPEPRPHQGASDSVIIPFLGTLFLVVGVEVVCLWAVRRRYQASYGLLQGESILCLSVCLLFVCQSVCP